MLRNAVYQNNKTRQGAALGAIAAVTVLHGLIHGYSIFLSPLNEQMRLFFGAGTITAITAMKATYLVIYATGNLFVGVFTNRLSARATLATGMVVNGLAVAGFALVGPDQLPVMHLLWGIAALGGSVYHPIANVLITRLYPNRKGTVLGITGMGAAVGFAFAPLLTGLLSGQLGFGWQQIALLFGVSGAGMGIVAWFFIPGRAAMREHARTHPPEPSAPDRRAALTGSTDGAATSGTLLIGMVIAIACLREIAMWSVLDISDFFLTAVLADSTRTGWFLFLLYLPGVFVKPLVGSLSDRIGRAELSGGALLLYGLTFAAAAIAGPGELAWVYLLMGVGQAATIPSIEAIVADRTTAQNRGLVFGIFVTAGIGLGAVGPLVSGIVLDAWGGSIEAFRRWYLVLGALPFAGGMLMVGLRSRLSR
ncbi:MAG: MFS transporter [Spirochaetaceae bacterium]|nr:MAG: MFS transporter [Spirochaetaceae bacterium]